MKAEGGRMKAKGRKEVNGSVNLRRPTANRQLPADFILHPSSFILSEARPKVAVIIVSYNSAQVIGTCLTALLESDCRDIEAIVVDNGSCDSTCRIVRDRFPSVRLIETGANLGFAGGCNVGFKAADAEIVVLLNDDAIVRPDTVSKMVEFASSRPDVGIVGCKILYPDGQRLQHAGAAVLPNGLTRHYGYGELDTGQYDRVFDCEYVTGAAMAIKRELLDELGPFDSGYYPAYFEEAEYCQRAVRLGYRVVYLPTAVVYHEESRSASKGSLGFYRMYHSGRLRFVLKNFTGRRLLRFVKEEARWLARYGLRHQARPVLSAYVRTAAKLAEILAKRRRDWVKERLNPRIVKSAVDFSESVFHNRLEGFSPILDWRGQKVRGVARKASFRLLADSEATTLGLNVSACDGQAVALGVSANGRPVGRVELGDYMQTLRFDLPRSDRSDTSDRSDRSNGSRLIRVCLRPVPAGAKVRRTANQPLVAVKSAWVQ